MRFHSIHRLRHALYAAVFTLVSSAPEVVRAQTVFEIDVPANRIVYSTQTSLLYATVPSSAGEPYGNRVIAISPATGSIVGSVFVGSEPNAIAVSPDAPIAYVGMFGAPLVRSLDLTDLSAGPTFGLGSSAIFGPLYANDISVMPGTPTTIAVSRSDNGFSPSYQGVAIVDSGVMRPVADTNFTGGNSIAFGDDPGLFYGYDNEVSDFNFNVYSVTPDGIALTSSASYVISGYYVTILYDRGTIYATSGAAIDAATSSLVGTYDAYGPVAVDDADHAVLFVSGNSVEIFDRDSFVPTDAFELPSADGTALSAANCGSSCLAAVFDSGQIFIVRDIVDKIFANGFE